MAEKAESSARPGRGLLDTSVVIGLERLRAADLPGVIAVSAITMAELAAGPHATDDPAKRALRTERLQGAEATFDQLPFDGAAARAPTDASTRPSALLAARRAVGVQSTC